MKHLVPPAQLTIEAMKGLLNMRRSGRIKRIPFLKAWSKLRRLLTLSKEYQLWRHGVKSKAGGACEQCGEEGRHAHHKEEVARNPDRALDPKNGEFLCVRCHGEQPRHNLRNRSGRRGNSRSAAGHRTPRGAPSVRSSNSATPRAGRRPSELQGAR